MKKNRIEKMNSDKLKRKSTKKNKAKRKINPKISWNQGYVLDTFNKMKLESESYLRMANLAKNEMALYKSNFISKSQELARQISIAEHERNKIFGTTSTISTIIQQMKLENREIFQGLVHSMKNLANTALASAVNINDSWKKFTSNMPTPSTALLAGAQLNFSRAAEVSLIAENTFLRLTEIGSCTNASAKIISHIENQSLQLTKSYAELMKGVTISEMNVLTVHPYVTELPPKNYLSEVNFIESISISKPLKFEEKQNLDNELIGKVGEEIEFMLKKIDPELLNLYKGARHVLQKKGPDYKRHLSISMRELYREITKKLASDDEIKKWTNSRNYFIEGQNKKPTRRAKIEFICRNLKNNPFNYTLDKGVDSVIWYIDLLGKGSHNKILNLDDFQMEKLMCKIETIIFTILKVGLDN